MAYGESNGHVTDDQRSDAITDKLLHASIFKLPHVPHHFVNYTLLIITFDLLQFCGN